MLQSRPAFQTIHRTKSVAGAIAALSLLAIVAYHSTASASQSYILGPAPASQQIEFDLYLPLQNSAQLDALLAEQTAPASANYHKWLTPQQFNQSFGPAPATMAKAGAALSAAGLTIISQNGMNIHVSGTVSAIQTAFGVKLNNYEMPDASTRVATDSALHLPPALQAIGARVVLANPSLIEESQHEATAAIAPTAHKGASGPFWYNDLKQAYDYPSYQTRLPGTNQRLDGSGVKVAVMVPSDLSDYDLAAYFGHENFSRTSGQALPKVAGRRTVSGGQPYSPSNSGSFEGALDAEQILGGAPGASLWVYNLPWAGADAFLAGYFAAVSDNTVDVVATSYGLCELYFSAAYGAQDNLGLLDTFNDVFRQGNAQGMTFVAASGNGGGLSCAPVSYMVHGQRAKWIAGINHLSASPYVTAVGGTNLVTAANPLTGSAYVSENASADPMLPTDPYAMGARLDGGVWGSGGGLSTHFAQPSFQHLVAPTAKVRTTPDLAMHMGGCPGAAILPCGPNRSSVALAFNGSHFAVIGTSAAAAQFAGVVALLDQRMGSRMGNVNPYLYGLAAAQNAFGGAKAPAPFKYYRRDIQGSNGLYPTQPSLNYSNVTGNGTPDVRLFLSLSKAAPAGNPQTPSNP